MEAAMISIDADGGSSASEQMFFGGAPVAHVVLYYELLRTRRITELLCRNKARRPALLAVMRRDAPVPVHRHWLGGGDGSSASQAAMP